MNNNMVICKQKNILLESYNHKKKLGLMISICQNTREIEVLIYNGATNEEVIFDLKDRQSSQLLHLMARYFLSNDEIEYLNGEVR